MSAVGKGIFQPVADFEGGGLFFSPSDDEEDDDDGNNYDYEDLTLSEEHGQHISFVS